MELQKQYPIMIMLSLLFLFWHVHAQVPIPDKFDGFWYENRVPEMKSIVIEAFFDPLCPDSRDSWPHLKRALSDYGSRVSLVVHPFPLPYHNNAFAASRALHIVNSLNTSATYYLLELFFKEQGKFYNQPTFNMTKSSIVDNIAKLATKAVGESFESTVENGFTDTSTDHATRISFKYGCSRGVSGTPFFFVNGFVLPDSGSPLSYAKWKTIIDPLVSGSRGDKLHLING